MTPKPHPLQAAVRVAQAREEEAAKRLADAQQRLAEQENTLPKRDLIEVSVVAVSFKKHNT
ncbi:MAG TPA: hypothetical protein DIC59_05015, partial [Candidatus Competibacteraceae bacterium]|nr:hypothetical protein [Candidatus Competibacteraceae bacterium]